MGRMSKLKLYADGATDPYLTGLSAFWKMEGVSGANESDVIGSNTLTQANAVGSATGNDGDARTFATASSQTLSRAISSSLRVNAGAAFMVSAWVYRTGDFNFIHHNGGAGNRSFRIRLVTGKIGFGVYGTSGEKDVRSTGSLTDSTWTHILAWFDPSVGTYGTIYVSVDNQASPDSEALLEDVTPDSTGNLVLGDFTGYLDDVGIWQGVVPDSDMRDDLYDSGAGWRPGGATPAPEVSAGGVFTSGGYWRSEG